VCDIVVKKFMFAISSPDEFLFFVGNWQGAETEYHICQLLMPFSRKARFRHYIVYKETANCLKFCRVYYNSPNWFLLSLLMKIVITLKMLIVKFLTVVKNPN